ncbi:MAG: bifunctional 4-hydroxy-2-oxoglutarate aldolase/2-dehydro-3-deoxy-phosphogluconate aldolase [Balneolaceae bacterium]
MSKLMDQNFFSKKLLPAITLEKVDAALKLADTYLKAGLDVMEITFRTEVAATAIKKISGSFPEMKIGAGTLLTVDQVKAAQDAGAQFGLSPGLNEKVVRSAIGNSFPFIPGVSTPSEIELALDYNYKVLKLFPADLLGGIAYIRSLEGPYRTTGAQFIPMGGVNVTNLSEYLRSPIVLAAGGSWMAPGDLVKNRQFDKIGEIVRRSLEITRQTGT